MKHIVCLTKPYNKYDLCQWLNYHNTMGYKIHIIDNSENIDDTEWVKTQCDFLGSDSTYEHINGWPNQWQLFTDILNENRYGFNEGDYIAFIDDDEYLWYYLDYWKKVEELQPQHKNKEYETLEQYLDRQVNLFNLNVILMPQILMAPKKINIVRDKPNIIENAIYARDDSSSQGKVFVKYNSSKPYDFNVNKLENGHVPYVNGIRRSIVNGVCHSDTTYGDVDLTACLRLYHYHLKSESDWACKWSRGSAAVDHQWYPPKIEDNKNYGKYIIPDFTMINTKRIFCI